MEFSEKRNFKRIKRSFAARIRACGDNSSPLSAKWDIVTIKDLSGGGISFNHTRNIPLGDTLEFNISVPFSSVPLYSRGRICRIDENKADVMKSPKIPVHRIAAAFIEMDEAHKQALIQYAEKAS